MPKLYSARIILSALQRAGFIIISQKGSHIKLYQRIEDKVYTVIVPNHKEIAIGTFSMYSQTSRNDQKGIGKVY